MASIRASNSVLPTVTNTERSPEAPMVFELPALTSAAQRQQKGRGNARDDSGCARINYAWTAAMALQRQDARWTAAKYAGQVRSLGKKLQVRLDANTVKRAVCKKCNALLVPGVSSRLRTTPGRDKHLVLTCTACGAFKRYGTVKERRRDDAEAALPLLHEAPPMQRRGRARDTEPTTQGRATAKKRKTGEQVGDVQLVRKSASLPAPKQTEQETGLLQTHTDKGRFQTFLDRVLGR
ncbi:Ribonuclease P protein component 4 [Porphyridium purpureum]|uniref:Ribonuclease P protein component 4 n=1 Tax=Porphyridium purpureum TaxID=35688 RepID=A0A5J4YS03_PORPP|nr:Ribonuclease P protein component 4 [Porphyridium purpureum]|eukprot:POR8967..scf236_6